MKQQNDINKQFSENNNKVMSSYVTLIGSFIVVVGVYLNEFPFFGSGLVFTSGKLLFMTILVMLVLSFLAALSSKFGYNRRRDHVVACASSPDDAYSRICGNGRGKSICNYLLGAYGVFYFLFIIALILFLTFSGYIFINFDAPVGQRWIMFICGALSITVPLMLNCFNYHQYARICEKALGFEQESSKANSSISSGDKNISTNVNCWHSCSSL